VKKMSKPKKKNSLKGSQVRAGFPFFLKKGKGDGKRGKGNGKWCLWFGTKTYAQMAWLRPGSKKIVTFSMGYYRVIVVKRPAWL
jgi:hypothetical protein